MVRENRVFIRQAGPLPGFGSNYWVTALEPGAQVATGSSGSTIEVCPGHGFAAGDKWCRTDGSGYSGAHTVLSVDATHLYIDGTFIVTNDELIVNLGPDSGVPEPNYDGNGLVIYENSDYTSALTDATVMTDSNGRYRYWHKSIARWEWVRTAVGDPHALYIDTGGDGISGSDSTTDNAIVRWDGATGEAIQSSVVTIADTTGDMTGGRDLSISRNFTASGDVNVGDDLTVTGTSALADVTVSTTLDVTGDATLTVVTMTSASTDTLTVNGATGGNPARSRRIVELTESPFDSVGIYASKNGDYKLLQQATATEYWSTLLHSQTVNGTTCHAMNLQHLSKAFLSLHRADGSVVETGTWSSGSNAAAYNTTYNYSIVTSDDVTFTTPAGATGVGIRTVGASNGGLAKVLLDGDATLATNLFTAQTLVTNGVYPNTILVANGGTLSPTDRVLDFANPLSSTSVFNVTLDYDIFVMCADGLAAGVHTLQLVVTGYKRAASSDYRLYSSGYMYRTASTMATTANAVPLETSALWGIPFSTSAQEYAIQFTPTAGGSATFLGNLAHGYDNQTSLTIYVDGVATAPTAGTTTTGTDIEIKRVSELFHPNYAAGATKVCDVTTWYRLNRKGLAVTTKKSWLIAGTIGLNYAAMATMDRSIFSKGAIGSSTTDYTFSGSSTEFGSGEPGTDLAYVWDPGGSYLSVLWLPDVMASCNNFTNTTNLKVHIQDNATAICKIYFRRSGESNDEAVINGTIHRSHAVYRFAHLANTDEWLDQ